MDSPVWFITGASAGFGNQIAKEALSRGHKVIAAARNPAKIEDLKDLGATTVTLDVTSDEETVQRVLDEAHAVHGRLTHIVNSAGYLLEGAVEESTAEDVRRHYDTNVFGTHKVSRAATRHLRAQRYGIIINFGSIGSWLGHAGCAHYCATKFAVTGLTEGLDMELKSFGCRAVIVEPGYFRTNVLNAGARLTASAPIEAYRTGAAGEVMAMLDQVNNNQPGDPVKGSRVIVEVLTSSGVAKGKQIPGRLLIGSDCVEGVKQKCKDTLALVEEWEAISRSTDFPKGA